MALVGGATVVALASSSTTAWQSVSYALSLSLNVMM